MSHSSWKNVVVTCHQKYPVSVECCTQRCYCELVIKVVYDNFQDILVPQGAIQCSREYKKLLKNISIHFNCSTKITSLWSQHHSLSLLGVHAQSYYYVLCELSSSKNQIWFIVKNIYSSSPKCWPTCTLHYTLTSIRLEKAGIICILCSLSNQCLLLKVVYHQLHITLLFPAHIPSSPSCPSDSICVIYHSKTAVHHFMEWTTTEHKWNSWCLLCQYLWP